MQVISDAITTLVHPMVQQAADEASTEPLNMDYVNDPTWKDIFGIEIPPIPMSSYSNSIIMAMFDIMVDALIPLAGLMIIFPASFVVIFWLAALFIIAGFWVNLPVFVENMANNFIVRPLMWFFWAMFVYLDRGIEFGLVLAVASGQESTAPL